MPELSLKDEEARRQRRLAAVGAGLPAPAPMAAPPLPAYAELHALSNFSFQRGASHPWELAVRAWQLGYAAIAITDECSVAGVVRAVSGLRMWREEREEDGLPLPPHPEPQLIFGSEFDFGRFRLVVLAHDLEGWGHLCQYISAARMHEDIAKGDYRASLADAAGLLHCDILCVPRRRSGEPIDEAALQADLAAVAALFPPRADGEPGPLWLAVELFHEADDALWLQVLQRAGEATGLPLVAAGDVHMHLRSRKPLQDVLTAVRQGRPVADCGFALQPNAERHLRSRARLAGLYPADLLARTLLIAGRCHFDLQEIRKQYVYPREVIGSGETPAQTLIRKTWLGALDRYPLHRYFNGVPPKVCEQIQKELDLILDLDYEMFFLTVEDIVAFARRENILCQGRGSSANSAVCYCLGITAVNPEDGNLLFERFISRERAEPPDIDVDFEHDRREEVIQYIYRTYGRERAAIAAVVISYRSRSALRDAGKALGVDERLVDAFARDHYWFDDPMLDERLEAAMARAGVREDPFRLRLWIGLANELRGFPRHLSQHVGGFVLTQGPLTRLVPVEKASMEARSIIQWDKDDLDEVGMFKVDVLALGMLSCIRRALDMVNGWRGTVHQMHQLPTDDPRVYDMIGRADTVGVFQIESRAQMSMLPRLRPRNYYDLVIEVAIVRPGPIQGGMVHPYLRNRAKVERGEKIELRYPQLKPALQRTLGVPIFQEQVMQIAMIAAGFSAGQADRLRRAMAAWRRTGHMERFYDPLVKGMVAKGYDEEFAKAIFQQIQGFGEYGFPESHAASFAKLVTVSSWLKCYEPACFLAAILNAQPMGFYTPSQLIQDAVRHGVQVRPVDVHRSDCFCTLEPADGEGPAPAAPWAESAAQALPGQPAVRLGLRHVKGLSPAAVARLVEARAQAPFTSTGDLARRAGLGTAEMALLAGADALRALAGHRRQQVWEATASHRAPALLRGAPIHESPLALPAAEEGEEIVGDYASLGFSLRRHPLALLRPRLARWRLSSAEELRAMPGGMPVRACGIVTVRQRPGTAKGTVFVTLEDETGAVNVVVWARVAEQWREPLLKSQLLAVRGTWQRDRETGGKVCHLVAEGMRDLTPLLGRLARENRSRDFH
ncbi:error-prone DNA polymerase [uncultured Pseudacidovorax sp.]|uniref:error-prone DNA polymerase n=1 Tax=uncultured Pseudacidovorax sp. TaxID=679313 RepID=UPI0025F428E7|nr:error-prone DNA polymerase [uncultured Pseudacidovorax sp.]